MINSNYATIILESGQTESWLEFTLSPGEHIYLRASYDEEYVLHIGVHEHVCYQLIRSEIRCHEEVKPQHGVEIHSTKLENVFSQEEYHVDDNQVFCNGRCLEHNVFLNIIHGKVMKLSAYYIIIMPYRPN